MRQVTFLNRENTIDLRLRAVATHSHYRITSYCPNPLLVKLFGFQNLKAFGMRDCSNHESSSVELQRSDAWAP